MPKLNKLEFVGLLAMYWLEEGTSFDPWDIMSKWYRYEKGQVTPELEDFYTEFMSKHHG